MAAPWDDSSNFAARFRTEDMMITHETSLMSCGSSLFAWLGLRWFALVLASACAFLSYGGIAKAQNCQASPELCDPLPGGSSTYWPGEAYFSYDAPSDSDGDYSYYDGYAYFYGYRSPTGTMPIPGLTPGTVIWGAQADDGSGFYCDYESVDCIDW
jgi:hypothetical protein